MLTLTPAAVDAVRSAISSEDAPPGAGLRITARAEGDEVEIDLALVEAPSDGDQVVEEGGARIYLDPAAADALAGIELDAHTHGDHFHFGFNERGSEA